MRPPSRTARDGVELPSLGTGQPPRDSAPSAGRPPRRAVLGVSASARRRLVVRSSARLRSAAELPPPAPPRVAAASCRGRPEPSGRRVPSPLGPATRRSASLVALTASADDGRLGLRATAPENGADTSNAIDATYARLLDGVRAGQHTHVRASNRH